VSGHSTRFGQKQSGEAADVKIHYLQHVAFEGPAAIAEWAAARRHEIKGSRIFAGEPFPRPGAFDALVVMGGPMSANDAAKFPWMIDEKRLIAETIARRAPVLGVCLGAQLIASAAGARVYPCALPEIGWFPVRLTRAAQKHSAFRDVPGEFVPLHWHGETFDLPRDAVLLAESSACPNQAFALGSSVLGLQFHLEATADSVAELIDNCRHELVTAPYVQEEREIVAGVASVAGPHAILYGILDRWVTSDLGRDGLEASAVR
jgi:GMP synthase-like glutamine amidotransferase